MTLRTHTFHPLIAIVLAAGIVLTAATGTSAQTTVAGVVSGALSVDETGSAGYTIPIAVPPGIAGIQPSVALVYQSHGGNGTAGVGWGLSAASSIHRCGQTLVQDGAIHGVDFSADDRFCLDGQRLVAISGTYGADGTEYRTEIESFARIISHGSAGSGPLSFTVETKSGRSMEYGGTSDARLGVPGASEIRLWSLNEVADTLGNAMTYHYVEDTGDKSYRLDHIEYTRNDGQSVAPQSEVRFVYEARPDTRTSFLAGAELAMTKRLAAIETWTDTGTGLAIAKSYDLTYETSPATSRSRLTSVTECDPSNNCIEPIEIGWQGQTADYLVEDASTFWGMTAGIWSNSRKAHILDHNGDGRSDILLQGLTPSNSSYLLTATDTGYSWLLIDDEWSMTRRAWAADQRVLHFLDYNGDGLSDILLQGTSGGNGERLLTSTGNGFNMEVINDNWGLNRDLWGADGHVLHILDYNGDGLSDVLLQGVDDSEATFLLTSNGNTFDTAADITTAWQMSAVLWASNARKPCILDYNGDGLSDILLQGIASGKSSLLLTSNGAGFDQEIVTNAWGMDNTIWAADRRNAFVIDHNGDGLSDILLQGATSGRTSFLLTSNGAGYNTAEDVTYTWGMDNTTWAADRRKFFVLDHNGDGLSDILLQGAASGRPSFLLTSHGSGFNTAENITYNWGMDNTLWAANERHLFVLDYDGNGENDILLQGSDKHQATHLLTHEGPSPDLLTSITDSLGRVSTLDYAPLTDDDVYAKDSDAVFPVLDIQAPLYVVKSVSSDDGVGGQKVTSYTYAGAKVHLQGRGFRGFRQMTATDEQTGIVTTTDYSQVFPTTAQVLSSVKTLADGTTTLKTLANTWSELSLNGGDTVWPFVATSVSADYEPNDGPANTPVVTRTATATFDSFGNPTELETTTVGGGETFSETTENTYSNDTVNWFLGLLTRTEVTRTRPGTP